MKRPRYLGHLGERAVFRFDSERALRRVSPRAESSHPGPFEPGLYLELPGTFFLLPRDFAAYAARVGHDLAAACSTPRLARDLSVTTLDGAGMLLR